MNKSMKCIILIFAVIMIMVITGLGFCKGRNQEKITKEKKIEKAENGEKTTKYVNNEVTKDKQTRKYDFMYSKEFNNCYILLSNISQALENTKFIAGELSLIVSLVLYCPTSVYEL